MRKALFFVAVLLFFLAENSLAYQVFKAPDADEADKEETSWEITAEIGIVGQTGYISQYSGLACYKKALISQSIVASAEKEGNGFYVVAENFSPSEQEARETDFYIGFYAEKFGVKVDGGYGYYFVRENRATDIHALYAEITLPSPAWGFVPFVKAEYDFSKKEQGEDMNGFMYFVGVKREFSLHERVKIMAEVGAGGNTGAYGLPAENLAYAREKIEISISILEWLKLKGSAMTQQNLGRQNGVAADTEKLFVSAGLSATF